MATIDDFKRMLDSMPPEEREAVLSSLVADYEGRSTSLADQQSYADELRGAEMPGMRRAGRFSVAASPLEFADTAVRRIRGESEASKVEEERERTSRRKEEALRALMGMSMGAGGPPAYPAAGANPAALALRALGTGR